MSHFIFLFVLLIGLEAMGSEIEIALAYEDELITESREIETVGPEEDWDYENKTKKIRPVAEPVMLCGTVEDIED